MINFNTNIKLKDVIYLNQISDYCIIDITDYNVMNEDLLLLKQVKNKVKIQDTNWFGGTWNLQDFLSAEEKLDKIVNIVKQKGLSPFESFIVAYIYSSNRPYKFAPVGSPFQTCRSYVDVLNKGYCVCVGYATILKRLCEKLGIECAVQGCFAKDKFGNIVNHANNLVFLKDEKYDIKGLFYSDPRMDCPDFQDIEKLENAYKLNMLALPITDIGKILIKVWGDDTIIEMNDFQSIYYSQKPTQSDLKYFYKFFRFKTLKEILGNKYCKKISTSKILEALKNIGFSDQNIEQTQKILKLREKYFFTSSQNMIEENPKWNNRIEFANYLNEYLNHQGRSKTALDCATFVNYVFKNFFDVDVLSGGYGKSWTGKIMTSTSGNTSLIDENASLQEKVNFIDTKCKIGDVLLFHRQSNKENITTPDNWYPGHCGIYLGNHKYIDSRLTTRGYISIVDIENDNYFSNFIGFKDFISPLKKNSYKQDNEKNF